MKWLRLYSNTPYDEKVRQLTPVQRWVWITLLCMASKSKVRGTLLGADGSFLTNDVMLDACGPGITKREFNRAYMRLIDLKMLVFSSEKTEEIHGKNCEVCCIKNWDELQFGSDTSTDRVRKFREMKRFSNVSETVLERPMKRFGNGYRDQRSEDQIPEEKKNPPVGPPRGPVIPYQEILNVYHETLPELQTVRSYTDNIKRNVKARWNEDATRQSLDWWKAFFKSVRDMPFLMGRSGDRPFNCTFQWLVGVTNMSKVLNGQFVDKKKKPAESRERCPECCRIDCICDRIREQHNVPDEELPF